jgi:hypothetical protein
VPRNPSFSLHSNPERFLAESTPAPAGARNDDQIAFSAACQEFTASGLPQSNNIRAFVRINIRPEEQQNKTRTLHKRVKGCGTRKFNPPKYRPTRQYDTRISFPNLSQA